MENINLNKKETICFLGLIEKIYKYEISEIKHEILFTTEEEKFLIKYMRKKCFEE